MDNPAVQTDIGPMVIVPLARWRPVRQSIVRMSEKRLPGPWESVRA